MSLEDTIKAAAKNAEGRLEVAAGELSGDRQMQAEGEAKQVQAQVMRAAGDLKAKAQDAISHLTGHDQ